MPDFCKLAARSSGYPSDDKQSPAGGASRQNSGEKGARGLLHSATLTYEHTIIRTRRGKGEETRNPESWNRLLLPSPADVAEAISPGLNPRKRPSLLAVPLWMMDRSRAPDGTDLDAAHQRCQSPIGNRSQSVLKKERRSIGIVYRCRNPIIYLAAIKSVRSLVPRWLGIVLIPGHLDTSHGSFPRSLERLLESARRRLCSQLLLIVLHPKLTGDSRAHLNRSSVAACFDGNSISAPSGDPENSIRCPTPCRAGRSHHGWAQSVACRLPSVPRPCRGSSVRVRLQMRMTHPITLFFPLAYPHLNSLPMARPRQSIFTRFTCSHGRDSDAQLKEEKRPKESIRNHQHLSGAVLIQAQRGLHVYFSTPSAARQTARALFRW